MDIYRLFDYISCNFLIDFVIVPGGSKNWETRSKRKVLFPLSTLFFLLSLSYPPIPPPSPLPSPHTFFLWFHHKTQTCQNQPVFSLLLYFLYSAYHPHCILLDFLSVSLLASLLLFFLCLRRHISSWYKTVLYYRAKSFANNLFNLDRLNLHNITMIDII